MRIDLMTWELKWIAVEASSIALGLGLTYSHTKPSRIWRCSESSR